MDARKEGWAGEREKVAETDGGKEAREEHCRHQERAGLKNEDNQNN